MQRPHPPAFSTPSDAPLGAFATAAQPTRPLVELLEYVARIAFFALVPFGVVLLSMLVPMGAALAQMLLALGAFFLGEVLVGAAHERPWLRRMLRRQLAFEAFYRQHPPRPFVYYVFYPLLFPYWLFMNREARREFWLFKGYTIIAIVAISAAGVYRWFYVYQPELGAKHFVAAFLVQLAIETLAVMLLIMPMTTSVVALHQKRHHGRLIALLLVGLLSAAVAAGYLHLRHRTFPSLETRQRVVARNAVNRVRSKAAMEHALTRAWQIRRQGTRDQWERDTDGTLLGVPLDQARDVLEEYFRDDEAGAFELWTTSRRERPAMMVLFAEGRRKGNPVWLGMRSDGTVVDRITEIPKSARRAMRSAGEL